MNGLLIKMLQYMLRLFSLLSVIDVLQALQVFPNKFVLGNFTKNVTLTCNTTFSDIVWKSGDDLEPIINEANKKLHGNNLTLISVDQPDAGNYTCWNGNNLLDHHFLVIQDDENENVFSTTKDDPNKRSINCWASSYNCSFTCTWATIHPAVFRAKITRNRNNKDVWHYLDPVKCKENTFQQTFSYVNYSPYEEEYEPLFLKIEAMTEQSYSMIQHQLFIRDIIKPDVPDNFKVKKTGSKTNVSWTYPSTWTRPFSYFPLTSEVECMQKKKDNEIMTFKYESGTAHIISEDVQKCRLHIRDSYYNSHWSNWTPWEKVSTSYMSVQ
ncbi:interleukin-12 subunit beta-like [Protopterus annectens]|uniref:interleukin-12 subunit beta-like n=1 Tax=Protopterus annectens TaxID=7888 RepID=UPI001CFA5DC0|nr:interleukin-12 subunit beta-like [Protopterus annectens]